MSAAYASLIDTVAERHRLPGRLILAVVQAESGGNPWAIRYEPAFYDRYVAPRPIKGRGACTAQTESRMQATSWGLMQIMGATARDAGFPGVYLSELCDPAVGLEWGCRYLASLVGRYRKTHGWEGVVAAYNAGSPRRSPAGQWVNQPYVDKIRALGGLRDL